MQYSNDKFIVTSLIILLTTVLAIFGLLTPNMAMLLSGVIGSFNFTQG